MDNVVKLKSSARESVEASFPDIKILRSVSEIPFIESVGIGDRVLGTLTASETELLLLSGTLSNLMDDVNRKVMGSALTMAGHDIASGLEDADLSVRLVREHRDIMVQYFEARHRSKAYHQMMFLSVYERLDCWDQFIAIRDGGKIVSTGARIPE